MTIYIVTSGDFSDYSIDAVFTNRESADKYVDLVNRASAWKECGVEVWEADTVDTGRVWWKVRKDVGYKTVCVQSMTFAEHGDERVRKVKQWMVFSRPSSGVEFVTDVFAESEEKAKKIAIDRFTEYEAREAGI